MKKGLRKLSVYVIAMLVIALVAALVFLVMEQEGEAPPPVVLPSPVATDPLEPTETPEIEKRAEINPETVQAVLATLDKADSYHRSMTSTLYSGELERETSLEVWARGQTVRVVTRTEYAVKNTLLDGTALCIWYDGEEGVYSAETNRSAESLMGLTAYEELAALLPEEILDAGSADFEGETCIFIDFLSGALGYRNRVYVSIATGLVMCEESYDGETLIFAMRSDTPDISTPADEVFTRPTAGA